MGVTAGIQTYPSFEAVRLIDIAHILTRLEILIAINLLTMGFLRISVFFYGTVLGIAQLLDLRSYRLLVFPVGILMIILSLSNFKSITTFSLYSRFTLHPPSSYPTHNYGICKYQPEGYFAKCIIYQINHGGKCLC